MRILILGSGGFVGRNVKKEFTEGSGYEIYGTSRNNPESLNEVKVDLNNRESIAHVLRIVVPQVVINCAGIIDNNEHAAQNPVFTSNLLESIAECETPVKRIIISGSAAEYGVVRKEDIPVDEDTALNATSPYGLSKVKETSTALNLATKYGLPVTIARIFNPIGKGMAPKFLVPRIMSATELIKNGKSDAIEVTRLDSARDYVDVADIAKGIKAIVDGKPSHEVYNIGSGRSTTNQQLIDLIVSNSGLNVEPRILETSTEPEPLVAIQADITRMSQDFEWSPRIKLEDTIRNIVNDAQ